MVQIVATVLYRLMRLIPNSGTQFVYYEGPSEFKIQEPIIEVFELGIFCAQFIQYYRCHLVGKLTSILVYTFFGGGAGD